MKLLNLTEIQRLAKDATYPCKMEGDLWHWFRGDDKHRRQYFVLKANLLFSFSRKSDKAANAMWILDGYSVKLEERRDGMCFVLSTNHGDGNTQQQDDFFMATSAGDTHGWITALSSSSYDQLMLTAYNLDVHLRNFIPKPIVENGSAQADVDSCQKREERLETECERIH